MRRKGKAPEHHFDDGGLALDHSGDILPPAVR